MKGDKNMRYPVSKSYHSDSYKYVTYRMEFVVFDVIQKLEIKLGISYNVAEKQFKKSMTYLLFRSLKLDVWQKNSDNVYLNQSDIVLEAYLHELEINKELENDDIEIVLNEEDQNKQLKKIKEMAIINLVSLEEAYQLEQAKNLGVKQKKRIPVQYNK